jgi:dipeptidyl aminopeptidase/acylaminoacyl peptidase
LLHSVHMRARRDRARLWAGRPGAYPSGRKGALRIACVLACVLGQFLMGCTFGRRAVSQAPKLPPGVALLTQPKHGDYDMLPTLAPDGKSLFFVRLSTGGGFGKETGQIWRLALGDGRLDPVGGIGLNPTVSPDSKYLAFESYKSLDADQGVSIYTLPHGPVVADLADASMIAWSPNSGQVAVKSKASRQAAILLVSVPSGQINTLVSGSAGARDVTGAVWSPNSAFVAVLIVPDPIEAKTQGSADCQLRILRPDGSAVAVVHSTEPFTKRSVVWSADDRTVYFVRSSRGRSDLCRLKLQEPTCEAIAPPRPFNAVMPGALVWAHDRQTLWLGLRKTGGTTVHICEYITVSRKWIDPANAPAGTALSLPSFSPDGTWMFYERNATPGPSVIDSGAVVFCRDNGRADCRSPGSIIESFPIWSPDSTFAVAAQGHGGLLRIDPAKLPAARQ